MVLNERLCFFDVVIIVIRCRAASHQSTANISIPLILIPAAIVGIIAWTDIEDLRHNPRGHDIVRPDAAIDQSARHGHFLGTIEDLRANTNCTAQVAFEMLCLVLDDPIAEARARISCKQYVLAVLGVCAEYEFVFDRVHCRRVHVAVLVRLSAQKHVFFGEIFVSRVGHSANGESTVVKCEFFGVNHNWP